MPVLPTVPYLPGVLVHSPGLSLKPLREFTLWSVVQDLSDLQNQMSVDVPHQGSIVNTQALMTGWSLCKSFTVLLYKRCNNI